MVRHKPNLRLEIDIPPAHCEDIPAPHTAHDRQPYKMFEIPVSLVPERRKESRRFVRLQEPLPFRNLYSLGVPQHEVCE